MKKQLLMSAFALFAATGTLMAQEGAQAAPQAQGMQKEPNARAKETLLKLQGELGLSNEQGGKAYAPFFDFYTAQQKMMDEMRASGTMDREKMRADREALVAARDKQLETILTPAQMKKWKDEIEPAMRPARNRGGQ